MWIGSKPNITEVDNAIIQKHFMFQSQKINKQGNVELDVRDIMHDNSNALDDLRDDINSYFGQRHKELNPLVFFDELEVEIVNSLFFAGVTFDDIYLGRPQDWST